MRGQRVVQRFRTRFFYLKAALICLCASLFIWSLLEGPYRKLSALSFSLAVVMVGLCFWVLIVAFPSPFSSPRSSSETLREILFRERIKTCILILSLSSTLFLLHFKSDPSFPKTGVAVLLAGYVWCTLIIWPEQKRLWREDRARAKKEGWRWGL